MGTQSRDWIGAGGGMIGRWRISTGIYEGKEGTVGQERAKWG